MSFVSRHANKKPDAGTYFLGLVVGLFLACIFLQMPGDNAKITRAEATYMVGSLQACNVNYRKGHLHSIGLILSDMDKQFVHQVCTTSALADTLSALPVDTEIMLLVHPKSHNILEIQVNGNILLEFEHSQELLERNASGFGVMGIGLIVLSIFCAVNIIILEIKLYCT